MMCLKKRETKVRTETLYEYGDGIYSEPLIKRVEERVKKFSKKHHVIDVDYDWHPEAYLGKNCLGMDRWKPRECYIHIKYKE